MVSTNKNVIDKRNTYEMSFPALKSPHNEQVSERILRQSKCLTLKFEFKTNKCIFLIKTRARFGCVFRAGHRRVRRLPQTLEKSITTPRQCPHAELGTKLNTAHPFPYYVMELD